MQNKISIPNPCQEDWNKMQPGEQGKHCLVCAKTVVDFSDWEPEAITAYLGEKAGQRVCGRFKTSQLQQPAEEARVFDWPLRIGQSGLSVFRKIAAVIIVVFGLTASSCEGGDTTGKIEVKDSMVPQMTTGIILEPDTVGKQKQQVKPVDTVKKKTVAPAVKEKELDKEVMIMGEPALPPQKEQ